MHAIASEPLTREERLEIFRIATRSLPHRYADQVKAGMTDPQLQSALEDVLGIFGGSGGPNQVCVTHQAAGLRIWGGRQTVNHVIVPPLFKGDQTLKMAREVYGISDPSHPQVALF